MMRKKSREMAFCGVLCALSTAVLLLGGVLPAATDCAPLLAAILLLPVLTEFGVKAAWTTYAAVALLALGLAANRETAAAYLFFGAYPMVRPAFSRIRLRGVRFFAKLACCNLALWTLCPLLLRLFAGDAAAGDSGTLSRPFFLTLLLLENALFFAMDLALERMQLLWKNRLRRHFFPS